MALVDQFGRPVEPRVRVLFDHGHTGRKEGREEPEPWYSGPPAWEQIPRKLPDGVSLAFDASLGVWILRDLYRPEPVIGCTADRELGLDALQNYVAEIRKRQCKRQ